MLLHLIRHGRPVIEPESPAREWELDATGFQDIRALREASPPSALEARWFSSDEPKAMDPARLLTRMSVEMVPGLREASRGTYLPDHSYFVDAVNWGLRHPTSAALPGWEPLEQTRRRVAGTVATITSQASGDVVLIGHATAWTLLVADLLREPLPPSVPAMIMPDLLIVDTSTRTLLSSWGEWRP